MAVSALASVEIQQTILRALSHVSLINFASSALLMLATETVNPMLLHVYLTGTRWRVATLVDRRNYKLLAKCFGQVR
jgi:hypothetical protein